MGNRCYWGWFFRFSSVWSIWKNNWTIIRPIISGGDVAINNFANTANLFTITDEGNVGLNENTPTSYYSKTFQINGIENRIEQIIANLLDNSISFCKEGENIFVNVSNSLDKKIIIKITDEGQGFKEKDTSKIFKRFYSNRPTKFGEHSGLGLNIVKNIVELHKGTISASNRVNSKGAKIEVLLPKFT